MRIRAPAAAFRCADCRVEQLVQGTLRPTSLCSSTALRKSGRRGRENAAVRAAPIASKPSASNSFAKCATKYLERARAEPGRIEVIDATVDATQVAAAIERVLARRLA